jgi:hypothetical protein
MIILKFFWIYVHSSLPQYGINYDSPKAYDTGPMYKISWYKVQDLIIKSSFGYINTL